MADLILKKISPTTFSLVLEEDQDKVKRWRIGEDLMCKVTKPRNLQFHKKMRVLLQVIFDNQNKYANFEDFYVEMKLKSGWYREHVTLKGKLIYTPKSLSFDQCDEFEAQKIYDRFIDVGLESFCQGSSGEEINRKVMEILQFT